MASISGTADGAEDLWGVLLGFIQQNGWVIVDRDAKQSDVQTALDCVQLKGEDASGQGAIYVHLIYQKKTTDDIWSIQMEGSAGWLPGSDVTLFGQNPQNSYKDVGTSTTVIVRTPLHRNPIQYWITASPRRFMGAFRHNDRWGALYCGFILPYGTPKQWPYPLWIAGNNVTTDDYKTITNGCPWGASSVVSGMLYCPSGRWQSTPISAGPTNGRGYGIMMWPWTLSQSNARLPYYKPIVDKSGVEQYALLNPIFYCANASEYGTFGEPDGLCQVTGWGASGGDTLTAGGQSWLMVQREMSTANQTAAAMILE
jgi:hypothetical protein